MYHIHISYKDAPIRSELS